MVSAKRGVRDGSKDFEQREGLSFTEIWRQMGGGEGLVHSF